MREKFEHLRQFAKWISLCGGLLLFGVLVFVVIMMAYFPGLLMEFIIQKNDVCPSWWNASFNGAICPDGVCIFRWLMVCGISSCFFWASMFLVYVLLYYLVQAIREKKWRELYYTTDNPTGVLFHLSHPEDETWDREIFSGPVVCQHVTTAKVWRGIMYILLSMLIILLCIPVVHFLPIPMGYLITWLLPDRLRNNCDPFLYNDTSITQCRSMPTCRIGCSSLGVLGLVLIAFIACLMISCIQRCIHGGKEREEEERNEMTPLMINLSDMDDSS